MTDVDTGPVAGLRVVVVDDHPVFRTGLRTLLEDLGVQVVAEESDGAGGVTGTTVPVNGGRVWL